LRSRKRSAILAAGFVRQLSRLQTVHSGIPWHGRALSAALLLIQLLLVGGEPFAHARHQEGVDPIRAHLHAEGGSADCPPAHSDCQLCRFTSTPRLVVSETQLPAACPSSVVRPWSAFPTEAPRLTYQSPLGSRAPPLA
jgi:hypothetical protein